MPSPRERVSHSLAEHIADTLRAAISAGTYTSGEKLPSFAELAETHNAAKGTVQKAINTLADEKLIQVWPGKGAFVLGPAAGHPSPQATIEGLYWLVRRLHNRIDGYEQRLGTFGDDADGTSKPSASAPVDTATPPPTSAAGTAEDGERPQVTINDLYTLVLRLHDRIDGYEQRLSSVEDRRENRPR